MLSTVLETIVPAGREPPSWPASGSIGAPGIRVEAMACGGRGAEQAA
jgi:hypothetical protein